MKKLRKDFNNFKENQEEFNQRVLDRFVLIDDRVKSLEETAPVKNEESESIDDKTRKILEKLDSCNERIWRLENQNPAVNQEPNNKIKFRKVKEISKKFASSTAFYGVARAIRAKSVHLRIIWTLMTVLSLSAGLYIIAKTTIDFYKYDVFTQTKRIHPQSILLPAISFCSDANLTDLNALFEKAQFIESNTTTSLTGISFHESNFDSSISRCIKFNNYQNKSKEQLLFNKDLKYDYFSFYINLNASFTDVNVFLSDNYLNILDWSQLVSGFGDKTRGRLEIQSNKRIEHKLEEPYNDCQLMSDETYRQVNCIAQCKNKKAITKYNCTLISYYYSRDYKYCDQTISEIFETDLKCEGQCSKECTSIKFKAVTSFVESSILNDSLIIWVYPLDKSYLEISQTPTMTGFSLISEIGGSLGLFIGISFLSLLEFLEYLSEIFFVLYF